MCFQSATKRGNGRCFLWPLTSAVNSLSISVYVSRDERKNSKITVYYTDKMTIRQFYRLVHLLACPEKCYLAICGVYIYIFVLKTFWLSFNMAHHTSGHRLFVQIYIIFWYQELKTDESGSRDNAWTILGSALLPSLNSSNVSLSSWFLSIWSNIFSTRFCGVFSSSAFDCWPYEEWEMWSQERSYYFCKNLYAHKCYSPPFDKLLPQYCTFLGELCSHHYQHHIVWMPLKYKLQ